MALDSLPKAAEQVIGHFYKTEFVLASPSNNPKQAASQQPGTAGGGSCNGGMDKLDVDGAFEQYAKPLENFLIGILRNSPEARDALQATFVKLMEKGDKIVNEGALKGWLYRVAYNEAMLIKRKAGTNRKHVEKLAWTVQPEKAEGEPIAAMLADERHQQVREALQQLSDVQQEVVRKRIYEGLKFREIADQLNVPLGTVLARMHSSLSKLKSIIEHDA